MTGKLGRRESRQEVPKPRPSASHPDCLAKMPGLALPADLGRSLRPLNDDALDRLVQAAIAEARRRGRDLPQGSMDEDRQVKPPDPAKGRAKKAGTSDRAGGVTPGQQRLILAAREAGLKPAAIAREYRLSRPAVQHVIIGAQRGRRKTERQMVGRHGQAATSKRLNQRGCGSMTGSACPPQGDREKSRQDKAPAQIRRHGTAPRDMTRIFTGPYRISAAMLSAICSAASCTESRARWA